jgi:hypothetical protein
LRGKYIRRRKMREEEYKYLDEEGKESNNLG